jgi:hypothetical protein
MLHGWCGTIQNPVIQYLILLFRYTGSVLGHGISTRWNWVDLDTWDKFTLLMWHELNLNNYAYLMRLHLRNLPFATIVLSGLSY